MKNVFLGILLMLSSQIQAAINFDAAPNNEAEFNAVLQKAKKQNKLIFLYFSASWCRPCKQFDRQVLSEQIGTDFYNENFINIKIYWENDEPFLTKRYQISTFPTYYFINDKKEIIHRAGSILDVASFLDVAKQALSRNNNFSAWEKRIKNGDFSYDLVKKYLNVIKHPTKFKDNNYECPAQEALDNYFQTQKKENWSNQENWYLIKNYVADPNSEPLKYLMQHYELFVKKYGKLEVDKYIYRTWDRYTSGNMNDRWKRANQEILEVNASPVNAILERKPLIKIETAIRQAATQYKKDSLTLILVKEGNQIVNKNYYLYGERKINNWSRLGYKAAMNKSNKETLYIISNWMKKVSTIAEGYEAYETYSLILSALEKKDKALEMQLKSLEIAQKNKASESVINHLNARLTKLKEG